MDDRANIWLWELTYSSRSKEFKLVRMVEFCVVCSCPAGHPDLPRPMGVYDERENFYCSLDCFGGE